jgi:hypothetical protein
MLIAASPRGQQSSLRRNKFWMGAISHLLFLCPLSPSFVQRIRISFLPRLGISPCVPSIGSQLGRRAHRLAARLAILFLIVGTTAVIKVANLAAIKRILLQPFVDLVMDMAAPHGRIRAR